MLVRKPGSIDIRAIISIHGQREYPVEAPEIPDKLVLRFDDTEAPSTTDPIHAARIRLRQRRAAEDGLQLSPPSIEDAKSVIEFSRNVRKLDGILLCQCQAGISRSPAAALLCLATWTGPGHEQYCVEQVLAARPSAFPHLDVVRFGDELLGLKGKLTEALRHLRPT